MAEKEPTDQPNTSARTRAIDRFLDDPVEFNKFVYDQLETRAIKLENEPTQSPWKCPICGHDKHKSINGYWNGCIGPGSHIEGSYYCCCQCTVHFTDPESFNAYTLNRGQDVKKV